MIEDYDSQMPFRFTGTLEKLTIELAPQSMSMEDQRELERRQLVGAIAYRMKEEAIADQPGYDPPDRGKGAKYMLGFSGSQGTP